MDIYDIEAQNKLIKEYSDKIVITLHEQVKGIENPTIYSFALLDVAVRSFAMVQLPIEDLKKIFQSILEQYTDRVDQSRIISEKLKELFKELHEELKDPQV